MQLLTGSKENAGRWNKVAARPLLLLLRLLLALMVGAHLL
jgi:hypothetical protein